MIGNKGTAKERAARAGAELVESGMVVGLGSGSTSALMVGFLGQRVRELGLAIMAVATSEATAQMAREAGIPLLELDEVSGLDISLDGADEIDGQFAMIKGLGGALLREKIVAAASRRRVTLITAEKRVTQLGLVCPLPIEVSRFGLVHTERGLKRLGAETKIRRKGSELILTDGGNCIIDCEFAGIPDPAGLDPRVQGLPGVLETGLFVGLCDTLIIGSADRVEHIEVDRHGRRAGD